jgi:hypothetical protein
MGNDVSKAAEAALTGTDPTNLDLAYKEIEQILTGDISGLIIFAYSSF